MLARVPLLLEPQPEGGYVVTSPLLPELVTQGEAVAECISHAQDAFSAVVELYEFMERPLPPSVYVDAGTGSLSFEILVPFPESDDDP